MFQGCCMSAYSTSKLWAVALELRLEGRAGVFLGVRLSMAGLFPAEPCHFGYSYLYYRFVAA